MPAGFAPTKIRQLSLPKDFRQTFGCIESCGVRKKGVLSLEHNVSNAVRLANDEPI